MEGESENLAHSKHEINSLEKTAEDELKFMEAKKDRLKMQEAAEILENRILYLEKMNNKVQSKTENARKKGNQLIKIKKKLKKTKKQSKAN